MTKQLLLTALRRGQATEEQLNHVWEELKYFYWGDRESNFNFTSIHEARRLRQEQQQLHKHPHPHVHKQHHAQRSPRKVPHESSVKKEGNEALGATEQSGEGTTEVEVTQGSDHEEVSRNKDEGEHDTMWLILCASFAGVCVILVAVVLSVTPPSSLLLYLTS
jgi:hypothetical protein